MNKFFQSLVRYPLSQIAFFSVLIGALYYFIIYDDGSAINQEISELQEQIAQEETKRADTEKTLSEEARMKDALVILTQEYQSLSRKLPAALSSIDINRNIEAFARESGVSIKNRRPENIVRKEIIDEVPVVVGLEGGFAELAQFIYYVSAAERVTSLRKFIIQPLDPKSTRLRLEGTVLGYKLAEEKPDAKKARGR